MQSTTANIQKKRKAPATAAAAAKRPAVANPYTKNNTDGRLAALAEEQEQEGTRDSTTASNNAELEQARSITNVDNSAEHIAAIFCKFRGLPPKPTKIEIAGRQAEQQMRDLCTFLSTRHIPVNVDDKLNPLPNSRNNRCVKDTTLGKYAGKYLKRLRKVDPDHEDWKGMHNKQYPVWWSGMLLGMKTDIERLQKTHSGDIVFGTLNDITSIFKIS
jgi:hypothetical protein